MPDQPLDPPPVAAAGAPAADLVRVRVDLAYDGTDFAGWARQPGLRTVQGVVEDGLALVLRSA
ncbi:tRNA pseudouridine(38-40) synthase TruA, partial [Cellulomonas hominis]|nr:tRNA pseudouridine(38-40) synthase TruA [Cellulomonas hominis]